MPALSYELDRPLSEALTESVKAVKVREGSALTDLLSSHQNRSHIFGGVVRWSAEKLVVLDVGPLALCDSAVPPNRLLRKPSGLTRPEAA